MSLRAFAFVLIFLTLPFVLRGASVAWSEDIFACDYTTEDGIDQYSLRDPFLTFYGLNNGSCSTFYAESYAYMEFSNSFVRANPGDIITPEYMSNKREYFYVADFDRDGHTKARTDYEIIVNNEEHFFLAYATSSYASPDKASYGWYEFAIGDDGLLGLVQGLSSNESEVLVVGAVPEPSGGTLLLLGLSALMLCRSKRPGAPNKTWLKNRTGSPSHEKDIRCRH